MIIKNAYQDIIKRVIKCAHDQQIYFSRHALERCEEREVTAESVIYMLSNQGIEIVQSQLGYKGQRGLSHVIFGRYHKVNYHMVLLEQEDGFTLVTVYKPDSVLFTQGGRTVKKSSKRRASYRL